VELSGTVLANLIGTRAGESESLSMSNLCCLYTFGTVVLSKRAQVLVPVPCVFSTPRLREFRIEPDEFGLKR
jgi:hypothetical protein